MLTRRFSFVMVVAPRPGSPAEKAGLRTGDILKTIDERHTRPMPAVVAERLLRGAPGSSVKLGVLRAGADPFDVTVVRERVLPAAPQGRMLEGGIGYVKVTDFTPTTAEDVRTQVEALEARRRGAGAARPARRGLGRARRRRQGGRDLPPGRPGGEARRAGARRSGCCRPTPRAPPGAGRSRCSWTTAPRGRARSWPRPSSTPAGRSSWASTRSGARRCRRPWRSPRAASC